MNDAVALLIPHYNDPDGLKKSLGSVSGALPLHVLVVDDGSDQVPVARDIQSLVPDHSLEVISLGDNRGIEHALNAGLEHLCKREFDLVARLDCGDVSAPERFRVQRDFLARHGEISLVGSWVRFLDREGRVVFPMKYPVNHDEIRKKMFFNNMFNHSSVMFRTTALDLVGQYPLAYPYAEDYAFFFEFTEKLRTANIPEFLVDYTIDPGGLSLRHRKAQIKSRLRIIWQHKRPTPHFLWGMIRNTCLLLMPYPMAHKMKTVRYR